MKDINSERGEPSCLNCITHLSHLAWAQSYYQLHQSNSISVCGCHHRWCQLLYVWAQSTVSWKYKDNPSLNLQLIYLLHPKLEGLANIHICRLTNIHTCIHAFFHTYIHTYCDDTYKNKCILTCMHAYIRTYIHTYIHTFIHPYIHTYMHAYKHYCICISTHILASN